MLGEFFAVRVPLQTAEGYAVAITFSSVARLVFTYKHTDNMDNSSGICFIRRRKKNKNRYYHVALR